MMNIFAIEGHKVICYTLDAGYETDKKRAKKYLQVGKLYTVEKTKVDNWSTDVYLKEFPGVVFNSVFFEDAEDQSEEKTKLHLDYKKYL